MKAIIPVAGLGTRMLPASKACSKELLPIGNKPALHLLVEELMESGVAEIILVVGKNKAAIKEYFKVDKDLERVLREKGQLKLLKSLMKIQAKVKFHFVEQKKPLGDGHALLCAAKYVKKEPCLVIFGDDLIDAKVPCSKQLTTIYKKYSAPVVALEKVAKEDVSKYGVVGGKKKSKGVYALDCFVEKPLPKNAPSELAIVGKYLITPIVLKFLKKSFAKHKGELRLIDAFRAMAAHDFPIMGLEFEGERFDTGNKLGYLKANLHYALKDQDIKDDLRDFMRKL